MALDVDRLTAAMTLQAVVELTAVYGGDLDPVKAQEGIEPMARGFASAIIAELQNFALVTVTGVTSGGDTENGTIS